MDIPSGGGYTKGDEILTFDRREPMAKSSENNQKIKVLKLMEMLRQDSDEAHPLTTAVICQRLAAMNIACDNRTVGRDMKYLNSQGYEVMERMIGHEKAYYVADRSFSIPEIKILMDAVQAACFITERKTAELTDKIAALGGSHSAELLKQNIVCFNTNKHTNESIFYNIGTLEEAISEGRQASFLYFDLDENRRKAYRREGERYVVEPMALIFNEDNYYLVCYNTKYGGTTNYRVDRMESVRAEEAELSPETRQYLEKEDIARNTEQAFKMFSGDPVNVKLRFERSLIGSMYDKFGEGTVISRIDGEHCSAMVKVQVSPTFFSWVCQFAGRMQILSPNSVRKQYAEHLRKAMEDTEDLG